jgi:signal transduction histidine kinase
VRTPPSDLLRTLSTGTAGVVGQPFLRALARGLATSLDAEAAYVAETVSDRPSRERVLASWPGDGRLPEGAEVDASDAALDVPIEGRDGSPVGRIAVVWERPIELGEDDLEALRIFAARAGAEIHAAAPRMRLLQSAEDERRRIGRTLHDGAQQRLVAIGHFLDVARKKMGDAAPDAAPLVERARDEAREAGRELRELARGLNPASLTEHGLGVALDTLAANCPLPVRVEAVPERRLPDPVETALYYLVSEALANAARRADATEVRVAIEERGGTIVAEVADDGSGPPEGSGPGGLEDRIAALGGTLTLESPPGAGTRLAASIPTDWLLPSTVE